MAYKINKYADKTNFIVEYNHKQNLLIQDGAELVDEVYTEFTYALLPNEIMYSEEVEIEVPDFDIETGEPIGTHTETLLLNYPIVNPNFEAEQTEARKQAFEKDFFKTSLGYVRRKVSMATGETKDFLSDLLPTISLGIQTGTPVTIIAYNEPDFTTDEVDWETLQTVQTVNAQFIQECFLQLSNDFLPNEVQNETT